MTPIIIEEMSAENIKQSESSKQLIAEFAIASEGN